MTESNKQTHQEGERVKLPLTACLNKAKELTSNITNDANVILRYTEGKRVSSNPVENAKMRQQIESLQRDVTTQLNEHEHKASTEVSQIKQQLEELTESQRKLLQQCKQERKESQAKIKELSSAVEQSKDAVETQIAKYHASVQGKIHKLEKESESQMTDIKTTQQRSISEVKTEIAKSHQSMKTEIGEMATKSEDQLDKVKHELLQEASQNQNVLQGMLANVLEYQKSQQLHVSSQRFQSTSTLDTVDTGFGNDTTFEEEEINEDKSHVNEVQLTHSTIPQAIKEIGLKLETLVHGRVRPLALHLGIDYQRLADMREDLDHRKDYRSLFWDVIAAWCDMCRRTRKNITRKDFLEAIQAAGIAGNVKPMSSTDRVIIEKNVSIMVRLLMVDLLVVELRKSGLLYPDIVNYIQESKQQIEKVNRLVDVLSILGDQALDTLIKALRDSEQGHIAEKIIEKDPHRFHRQTKMETVPKKSYQSQPYRSRTQELSLSRPTRCSQPVKESHV